MATDAKPPREGFSRFRQLRLVVPVVVLGGLGAAGLIAVELSEKIGELRAVPRDNVQWNTAQLEVDFLKLRNALDGALRDPETVDTLRKQFDIFYSRVAAARGSTQTLQPEGNPLLRPHQQDLDRFLTSTVPLIDASDAELQAALPVIDARLQALSDTPREFALGAVQVMANVSDAQRLEIIALLKRLAFVSLAVFGGLIVTLATMTFQRLELRRRAAAISQAGQMRDSTLRASLDAIVVSDADGVITDFNGSAEKIFGYARDEILGRKLEDTLVPASYRAAHVKGMAGYTTAGESSIVDKGRRELTALHKDGHEFPIELSISETIGEDGPNFISYIRDITEEKQAETELHQARDDALAAFREKSHFFAVMSHEMRTPLNGIMSALDLIRDDPLTEQQQRYVSIAESSSQVLLGHINDVLLIERLDSDENSTAEAAFSPVEVVEAVADSLRPLASQQNTTVEVTHDGPDAPVIGPPRALQQIVMNLLSNAIKFTPSGKVTVSTRLQPQGDDRLALTLEVTDTGIGISKPNLARIFEDFVTVDSRYERSSNGTGLGLGIVRRLVEQMSGTVTCDSEVDKGTSFRVSVTLPRAAQLDRPRSAAAPDRATPAERALEVLVVEDNPINSEVLEAMLQREGHRVTHARDGFEGVHRAIHAHFDLILMDVSMPKMNGLQATQEIRASQGLSKHAPIYAVTAHAMPKEVDEFLAVGMAGCILKPIRPEALRGVLGAAEQARQDGGDVDAIALPAAAEADEEMLDLDMLQDVASLLGEERFAAKLDVFITEGGEIMEAIRTTAEAGDLPALQARAHKLAGSCAIFGAMPLHAELQELESHCKQGDTAAARKLAADLGGCWAATRRAILAASR